MADDTPTDAVQAPATERAEAVLELVEIDSEGDRHKRRMDAAKLALTFVTRNVAGLGQSEEGDGEAWKARHHLLTHFPEVERAFRLAAVESLRLIAAVARDARAGR